DLDELLERTILDDHRPVFQEQVDVRLEHDEQVDGGEAEQQEKRAHQQERQLRMPVEESDPAPRQRIRDQRLVQRSDVCRPGFSGQGNLLRDTGYEAGWFWRSMPA